MGLKIDKEGYLEDSNGYERLDLVVSRYFCCVKSELMTPGMFENLQLEWGMRLIYCFFSSPRCYRILCMDGAATIGCLHVCFWNLSFNRPTKQ